MKYIILTYTMDGVAGGPSYVANKVKWLVSKGWEVCVFDHYGSFDKDKAIVLPELIKYEKNRLLELFFPPSYFSKKQRRRILEYLAGIIGIANDYVVESNSSRLSLWGELLAEKLKAKHLIFDIGENIDIRSVKEYEFSQYKLERNELFAINPRAIKMKFSGYKELTDEEAEKHTFAAIMGVQLEDVTLEELKEVPPADLKILSFGRWKPYFRTMLTGVSKFAHQHPDKQINFLLMGDVTLSNDERHILDESSNIFYKEIPAKRPVPREIFDYSDVVIATAGCANISFNAGYKTISMDVENNTPLGIMGFTTLNSVFSSEYESQNKNIHLEELLDDILINRKYDGKFTLRREPTKKGLDWQMSLINNDRMYYADVDTIIQDKNIFKRIGESLVLRFGGVKLFPLLSGSKYLPK